MNVVITGATGFIGSALVEALRDHAVTALVRDVESARERLGPQAGAVKLVRADLETQGPWCDTLDGADAILHLAGEPVAARRWNARVKQLIRDSRVESTRTIVEVIAKSTSRPAVLVTASGVDYYPFADDNDFDDDEVTESDPAAETTFLGRVCRDWEHEALAAEAHRVRVVCMRTGMVLGRGGALAKLRTPFSLFAGGPIGGEVVGPAHPVVPHASRVRDVRLEVLRVRHGVFVLIGRSLVHRGR